MSKAGWIFNVFLVLAFAMFLHAVYPKEKETGYSPEMIARMDDLVAGLTPLSVADLGMEAE